MAERKRGRVRCKPAERQAMLLLCTALIRQPFGLPPSPMGKALGTVLVENISKNVTERAKGSNDYHRTGHVLAAGLTGINDNFGYRH